MMGVEADTDRRKEGRPMLWRAGISLICGLWVLLTPFLLPAGPSQTYSDVITGVVIAALASWPLLERRDEAADTAARKAA
jgi:hypothetical protein